MMQQIDKERLVSQYIRQALLIFSVAYLKCVCLEGITAFGPKTVSCWRVDGKCS